MSNRSHPTPKPVEKIVLNEGNVKLRFILFILSFCVVIACAILIFVRLSKVDKGWTEIESSPKVQLSCGDDFQLSYNLGQAGERSIVEQRKVGALYTEKLEEAYLLFDRYNVYENINNVKYINDNLGVDIQVSPLLYNSLSKMVLANEKLLYLAPIYSYYDTLIASTVEDASLIDPYQNESVKEYFNNILDYVNNNHIKLNLSADNTVNLYVSNEYKAFLTDNDVNAYIDFGWMKNAFIVDYVADSLIEAGYVNGIFASYDGFSRDLDINNKYIYNANIFDNIDSFGSIVATTILESQVSSVTFRNFMYYQNDVNRYIKMSDGTTRNYYIDSNDGLSKSSLGALYSYSDSLSCSELALSVYDKYISESFTYEKVDNIEFIWCDNNTVYYTDSNIELYNLYNYGSLEYKGEHIK